MSPLSPCAHLIQLGISVLRLRLIATLVGLSVAGIACAFEPALVAKSATTTIDCAMTPFGDSVPMEIDREPLYLHGGGAGRRFDEYRGRQTPAEPEPLTRLYRVLLDQPLLTPRPLQTAITIDLNGDGRDEVVAAFSDNNGFVELGVYQRVDTPSPSAVLVDVWKFTGDNIANRIDLAAGDFDGSQDGKQELAMSWPIAGGADANKSRVVFLTGDANGHIAQADDATAGRWLSTHTSGFTSLAKGDFLLDGRDQVVLAAIVTVPATVGEVALKLDLLEFATQYPVLLPPAVGSSNVGSAAFNSSFAQNGGYSAFQEDYVTGDANQRSIIDVLALQADGGDLVDSAADELAVHLMFNNNAGSFGVGRYPVLGQRLLHFDTTRGANNALTGIALGGSNGSDSNRIVRYYGLFGSPTPVPPPAPAIDATVADVDGVGKAEILIAQSGREPASADDIGTLVWWAHTVDVRLQSAFRYKNIGGRAVAFTNHSLGDVQSVLWNFGDGNTSGEFHPYHQYASTGSKTVTLTVTPSSGSPVQSNYSITVIDGSNAVLQGPLPPNYVYRIVPQFHYQGVSTAAGANYAANSLPSIAVTDLDLDGRNDVLTTAYSNSGAIVRSVFKVPNSPPAPPYDYVLEEVIEPVTSVSDLKLLTADFDGDSTFATLGTDCRNVTDKQLRNLTWLPPYFSALQGAASKETHFGRSTGQTNSYERQTGSYTSHDVSGHIGAEVGFTLGPAKVEATLVFTAGKNWQKARGSLHGNETEYSIDQGFSQSAGEALVGVESNNSDCYSYNLVQAGTTFDPSVAGLRMCEVKSELKSTSGTDADNWNSLFNETAPVLVPQHWLPMQRDWANLALFRSVAGTGANRADATDGRFTTAASAAASASPYLEIDLGEVRDISAVRVFPAANSAVVNGLVSLAFDKFDVDVWGYRLYASETPFAGAGVPSGPAVLSFLQPHTGSQAAPTNEAVSNVWSIWTLDATTRAPLRARYLRVQHPGSAKVNIAEIQVFGATHADPQRFPDDVCDPLVGDGVFNARVWDALSSTYKTIEVRGDLMWTGSVPSGSATTGVPGCSNDLTADVPNELQPNRSLKFVAQRPIWEGTAVGDSADPYWELSESSTISEGSYSSIDSSTRVGVEFDFTAGFGVKVAAGAAYEFTKGITTDVQSSVGWTDGLGIGGQLGGFVSPGPGVVSQCQYYPRPYSFHLADFSSVGFRQDLYVTDYVVKHLERGGGAWQRNAVPQVCFGPVDAEIFKNSFE